MHTFFKEYVANLLSPTPLMGVFFISGLILLWLNSIRLAKYILTLAIALFIIFGHDPVTEFFLNDYENRYPAFNPQSIEDRTRAKLKYVVVLAGGYIPYKNHPLTTQLTPITLGRLIEGIRIQRELPHSKLVFTGKGWAKISEAQAMKEMAMELGVPSNKIIIEEKSKNTRDHTIYLKSIVGNEPFVLVTSALHMPRALGLFKKAGYSPLPASTGHILMGKYHPFQMKLPYALGVNLSAIDAWFIEFYGNKWAKFKGDVD